PAGAGARGGVARGVLPGPGLEHLAEHDRVDGVGAEARALDRGACGDGAELDRRQRGERALEPPLGRAGGGDDHDVVGACGGDGGGAHGWTSRGADGSVCAGAGGVASARAVVVRATASSTSPSRRSRNTSGSSRWGLCPTPGRTSSRYLPPAAA